MRVLSGFQPSGIFHLGNYFGSIKPSLEWQQKSEVSFFMVADLHALTSVRDAVKLQSIIIENVKDFLACGLDTGHSILFKQSDIAEHCELTWILSTLCPMGLMERAVSYKDKVERGLDASVGLFTYPILQASDIVLYGIDKVPVGKDQKQHLEMARDLAVKFNNAFGDTLVIPEGVIQEKVAVIPGTDGQKMSKSYGNTIPLFGNEKSIRQAIMGIVTDSKNKNDPKDPETCFIFQIHKLFLSEEEQKHLAGEYRNGLPYGEAKKKLYETYMDYFIGMREKRSHITDKTVNEVIASGKAKAQPVARATMERVRSAVGLV